jgi:hypothetical protein
MSRKRSTYRQKPVLLNPLAALRPASKEQRDRVMGEFLSSLDTMARGSHPGVEEWRSLSDAVNSVETLALHLHKLDPLEVMPTVNDAIAAMVAASKRFRDGQGMRLDAPGLKALRDVLAIYEQCLEGLTEREMSQAQAETQRRVSALLRSKTPSAEVIAL